MELNHVSFTGPPFEAESPVVVLLPGHLAALLRQINGFVQYGGGLHVRGVCALPEWHSLEHVMLGPMALHRFYPAITPTDVPFAQDCLADQFILRSGVVHRLTSETGEIASLGFTLPEFFAQVESDPIEFLAMHPLLRFQQEGGSLQPGQVLHAYPPFCTAQAEAGVSLKAVPLAEALAFLSDFSSQVSGLSDGAQFKAGIVP